ncbi:DNA-3-methyladenine glycosylase [Halomonas sp. WWR20]
MQDDRSHAAATIPPEPLPRSFYARPSLIVARELIGCHLVRETGDERLVGRIVETEAYGGAGDSASHASRGHTPRTATMFGPPGHAYIYLIYGMYDMLNLVTEIEGEPGAVLIRAITPLTGEASMIARRGGKRGRELANGPGKLVRAMSITLAELNRHDVCAGNRLWVEAGAPVGAADIVAGPRVGIDYAEPEHRDAAWRFRLAPQLVSSRGR